MSEPWYNCNSSRLGWRYNTKQSTNIICFFLDPFFFSVAYATTVAISVIFQSSANGEGGRGNKTSLIRSCLDFQYFFPLIASPLSSSSVNSPRAEFRSRKYVHSIQIFHNALSNSLLNSEKCYLWKYIYAFHKPKARSWCHLHWAITSIYSLYRKCS